MWSACKNSTKTEVILKSTSERYQTTKMTRETCILRPVKIIKYISFYRIAIED